MSGAQTLRALVNERLAAAAEDIFVLIERTIAEYEEELCRSKQENQRKQQLLDKVLSPRVQLVRANVQIPSESPGPEMNQEIAQTLRIKEEPEEQSVKQEEEQLPVSVPESSPVCVKTEESSLLHQRQTEHREETQGEDISSETHFHSETEGNTEHSSDTDNDDDWESPSFPTAKSTGLFPKYKSAPQTSAGVKNEETPGAEGEEHQCPFCNKSFGSKRSLVRHTRVHRGPLKCPTCNKTFTLKKYFDRHVKTHTAERPYSCTTCEKTFTKKSCLISHVRLHTGEKPYICKVCNKTFNQRAIVYLHMRTHTGEKPYRCPTCQKSFTQKCHLHSHLRLHTGEKPFVCQTCDQTFTHKISLDKHVRTHTGEKPSHMTQSQEMNRFCFSSVGGAVLQ